MVVFCENCEKWFCSECDDEGGPCLTCGRVYCGPCTVEAKVVCCPPPEDE